jgi:hypothetical protein
VGCEVVIRRDSIKNKIKREVTSSGEDTGTLDSSHVAVATSSGSGKMKKQLVSQKLSHWALVRTPVILPTWEAEIRRMTVQSQPG